MSAKYREQHKEQYKEYKRKCYEKHRDKYVEANRKWMRENPDYRRDWALRKAYNITLDDYNKMLLDQGGKCAICGGTESHTKSGNFCVDHDHETGQVRSLLCDWCNKALGLFSDNPELMRSAAVYIEKFKALRQILGQMGIR